MTKIIFFDIDGTLVKLGTTQMSEKTKYALQKCKENGIKIFIATGRPYMWVPKFDIEFDGIVSFNGQYCIDTNGLIYKNNIDPGVYRFDLFCQLHAVYISHLNIQQRDLTRGVFAELQCLPGLIEAVYCC